jgi:Ni/Fe-hydrogenase 1 B-type cytochrome subunit
MAATTTGEVARPVRGDTIGAPPAEGRPVIIRRSDERIRVYVWEIPVRVSHWVNVFSIAVLAVTGLYIADPMFVSPGGSFMTNVRFVHMLAAFAFTASFILRIYWLFVGNRWSRWTAFVPVTPAQRREFIRQTGWYLFLRREVPRVLGHNALAAGTYLVVFVLFLLQTATGFALAGAHGTEPWATLFGWLSGLIGLQGVRLVHHLLMWALLAFMVHHVYSALLMDHWERNGIMSSIFSGYKFVRRREVDEARDGGMDIVELPD